MTVQELIDQLKQLDPNRNVWTIYDSFFAFEPNFLSIADESVVRRTDGVKVGDYYDEFG